MVMQAIPLDRTVGAMQSETEMITGPIMKSESPIRTMTYVKALVLKRTV